MRNKSINIMFSIFFCFNTSCESNKKMYLLYRDCNLAPNDNLEVFNDNQKIGTAFVILPSEKETCSTFFQLEIQANAKICRNASVAIYPNFTDIEGGIYFYDGNATNFYNSNDTIKVTENSLDLKQVQKLLEHIKDSILKVDSLKSH